MGDLSHSWVDAIAQHLRLLLKVIGLWIAGLCRIKSQPRYMEGVYIYILVKLSAQLPKSCWGTIVLSGSVVRPHHHKVGGLIAHTPTSLFVQHILLCIFTEFDISYIHKMSFWQGFTIAHNALYIKV